MRKIKNYKYLIIAGVTPFIFLTLLVISGINKLPLLGVTAHISAIYSIIIVSFMAGIHWGTYLYKNSDINLLVTSNVAAIATFLATILLPLKFSLLVIAIIFGLLLAIDKELYDQKLLSEKYFELRVIITMIVCLCLVIQALIL